MNNLPRKISCTVLALLLPYQSPSVSATQCNPTAAIKERKTDALLFSAEQMTFSADDISALKGNVQLEKGINKIRADQVAFDTRSKTLRAKGKILYTACAKKNPSWFISAEELALNQNRDIGMVKNAWLHIGGLPLLYLPRHRFSLSDEQQRKSGFLLPRANYSSKSGTEFSTPWYFNIAPNKDATITPTFYEKRGLQLNFDSRYLYSYEHGGLSASWLDDSEYDTRRYLYTFDHHASIDDFFNLDIKVQRVSDSDYVKDLSSDVDLLSESYLRSYIEGEWFVKGWAFNFQSEMLQRADTDVNPIQTPYQYQTRPSLGVSRVFSNVPLGFNLAFQSQATQFVHKYRYTTRGDSRNREYIPIGNRYHSSLRLDWSYKRPWFFFTPAATLNYTHYKIYRDETIKRTQPIYSIHSGLSFEKSAGQGAFTHIIEPAFFYLNVPRREQSDIPLFDTTNSEFRFESLFFENRFNGIDRIGDADQLTLALSSRLMHRNSNKEALRASLGRIYYFRDPSVYLSSNTQNQRSQSPWAGEIKLNLNDKVKFLSSLVWDSRTDETLKFTTRLALKGGERRNINLYYRSQKDDFSQQLSQNSNSGFEQAGINFGMPINDKWTVLAGLAYDFDSSNQLSSFAGFDYRSCCWGLRFGIQRRLVDVDNASGRLRDGNLDYESFIGLEFNILGIGSVGTSLYSTFGREIFGYED